jgi:hypothetical protein
VEEVALLGHEADGGGQRCLADVPDVDAVDLDRAAGDVVQPRDQELMVVLPAPLGPTSATSWPGSALRLTPASASTGAPG